MEQEEFSLSLLLSLSPNLSWVSNGRSEDSAASDTSSFYVFSPTPTQFDKTFQKEDLSIYSTASEKQVTNEPSSPQRKSMRRSSSIKPGRIKEDSAASDTSSFYVFSPTQFDKTFQTDGLSIYSTSSEKQVMNEPSSPQRKSMRRSSSIMPGRIKEDSAACDTSSYYVFSPTPTQFDNRFQTEDLSIYSTASEKQVTNEPSSPQRKSMRRSSSIMPGRIKGIDPQAVGIVVIQKALRENTILDEELKKDKESMEWYRDRKAPCPCDVYNHPPWWSQDIISAVHQHSFLLNCQGLEVPTERVVAANKKKTIVVLDVIMDDGNPWKVKAEQVLRFIDVEIGVGDHTAYYLFYYRQPSHRRMFLMIASHMAIGLVVAEKQISAHRIMTETVRYLDLEEEPIPVRVGINILWVHVSMRRHGLGTQLCELVGKLFYKGEQLKKSEFCFNNYSNVGVAFAKSFLKTSRPPLYNDTSGPIVYRPN